MAKTVVGLYRDFSNARDAVHELVDAGFDPHDIGVMASDPDKRYASELEREVGLETDNGDNAAAGAVAGGLFGGIGGLLVGLGALAIPGLGPVIAAGPIVAALIGVSAGAVTGGILGALMGWGIPESEAAYYAEGVRRGNTLVTVANVLETEVDEVADILERHYPIDINQEVTRWREEGWTGYDPDAAAYTAAEIERERTYYGDDPSTYEDETDDRWIRTYHDDFEDYRPDFQQHYEANFAKTGRPYQYYEPAYRYGTHLARDERYLGRDWADIEPEVRRHWAVEHQSEGVWEEVEGAVKHAWYHLAGTPHHHVS